METRFILPATLATAFHVLVLFSNGNSIGYRTTTLPPSQPEVKRMVVDLNDPPEPSPEPETGAAEAKGNPEQYLPRLEEPPSRLSTDYVVSMARVNPRPDVPVDRIIPGPIGVPDGTIDGEKKGIISYKFLDNPPRTRSQVAPNYPADAKNAGVTGEVTVEFIVDEAGRVQSARVVQSTDTRFESATLRAVQKWRFEPGKKNGQAVRFRMVAPVVFSLET